jgi:hypothetical protein
LEPSARITSIDQRRPTNLPVTSPGGSLPTLVVADARGRAPPQTSRGRYVRG